MRLGLGVREHVDHAMGEIPSARGELGGVDDAVDVRRPTVLMVVVMVAVVVMVVMIMVVMVTVVVVVVMMVAAAVLVLVLV
ncbi:MAG TPA: hypothetical protein K8U80_04515, partial [Collinsella ihuae]|nr:hypothetical protein [Collinsella ihumii]